MDKEKIRKALELMVIHDSTIDWAPVGGHVLIVFEKKNLSIDTGVFFAMRDHGLIEKKNVLTNYHRVLNPCDLNPVLEYALTQKGRDALFRGDFDS